MQDKGIRDTIAAYPTLTNLCQSVISGEYGPQSEKFSRAFVWKASLLDIQTIPQNDMPLLDLTNIRLARSEYNNLLKLAIPWHLLDLDCDYYIKDSDKLLTCDLTLQRIPVGDDPLSLTKNNEISDKELLELIITDVERLFPDYPHLFINNQEAKRNIIEILFRFGKVAPKGYLQGMHEICGVIYLVLGKRDTYETNVEVNANVNANGENKIQDKLNEQIKELISAEFINHDTFAILSKLTIPLLPLYYSSTGLISQSILFGLKLQHIDPILANSLSKLNLLGGNSQVWLARWLRMLISREIGFKQAVRVWDILFAFANISNDNIDEPGVSHILLHVVIVLLLRIRVQLLIAAGENPTKISASASSSATSSSSSSSFSSSSAPKPVTSSLSSKIKSPKSKHEFDDTDVLYLLLHYPDIADNDLVQCLYDAVKLAQISNPEDLGKLGRSIIEKSSTFGGVVSSTLKAPNKSGGFINSFRSWTNGTTVANTKQKSTKVEIDSSRQRLEQRLQKSVRQLTK
ncbi:hypothetical protein DAMA08_051680 [Martiniozyma asiatica (nom. inval.)]|nr:hypothetical protein DAMA08_051680 [Martiniozyma asiatica]